jgi:hypothetical protein
VISDDSIRVRFQPHIRKLIERRASEEDMSISDYIRYAVMLECVYSGDTESYKMISLRFSRGFREWFNEKAKAFQKRKIML